MVRVRKAQKILSPEPPFRVVISIRVKLGLGLGLGFGLRLEVQNMNHLVNN
jgi:hypothetical protein